MRVKDFLTIGDIEEAHGHFEREVKGLTYDSRQANKGWIFFALPGVKNDGHDYVADTLAHGASAAVVERADVCPEGTTWIRVANTRRALGLWSAAFYGHPSAQLSLIGVTGTNGKTTVTY